MTDDNSSADDVAAVWVTSDVDPKGNSTYTVTVSANDDVAFSLKADGAVRYVAAVYRAAVTARHDAAVMKQLTGTLELPASHAAKVVMGLRDDREPVSTAATAPLRYTPIVSGNNLEPFVHVHAGETFITQWTPADCIQHASQVMEVLAGVDLDSAYLRYLVQTIGLAEPQARHAVNDLGNYGLRDAPSAAS